MSEFDLQGIYNGENIAEPEHYQGERLASDLVAELAGRTVALREVVGGGAYCDSAEAKGLQYPGFKDFDSKKVTRLGTAKGSLEDPNTIAVNINGESIFFKRDARHELGRGPTSNYLTEHYVDCGEVTNPETGAKERAVGWLLQWDYQPTWNKFSRGRRSFGQQPKNSVILSEPQFHSAELRIFAVEEGGIDWSEDAIVDVDLEPEYWSDIEIGSVRTVPEKDLVKIEDLDEDRLQSLIAYEATLNFVAERAENPNNLIAKDSKTQVAEKMAPALAAIGG